MSFRARLVAAMGLVLLATLAVATWISSAHINASQERQFDEALAREARQEAMEIAQADGRSLQITPRLGPSPDDLGPLTKFAVLYDEGGHPLDSSASWGARVPSLPGRAGEYMDFFHGETHLRGLVSVIPGRPGITLLLAAPRSDLDVDELRLEQTMVGVFVVAFLVTLLLTTAVVSQMTQVQDRVAKVARRVAAKELDARVGPVSGPAEIVQLAKDVDETVDHLASLIRSHGEFIAYAAHELRSPLTALYGTLSHAVSRPREANDYRDAIEEALDSARRLMSLTEDLLTLARVDRVADLPTSHVDLQEVCEEATSIARPEARTRGVRLELQATPVSVRGRFLDLVRVVRNLTENALRHAPRDSEVHLRVWVDATHAHLQVEDQGPGFDPKDLESVFEPFVRGSRPRPHGSQGTGLGLAIVREIVHAHGGRIQVSTGEAGGARIEVSLPREASGRS